MLDIDSQHLQTVKNILSHFVPNCEVRAFGSGCNGSAHRFSDLDLCVCAEDKLDWNLFCDLKDALTESDLPFRVDLQDYHRVPEHFRKNIDQGEVIIH